MNSNWGKGLAIVSIGICYSFLAIQSWKEDFIMNKIQLFGLGLIGIVYLVWTFRKNILEYRCSSTWLCFLPTFIGFLFIGLNLFLFFYDYNRKNAPTLISGFNDGGYNGFSCDFKVDGHYVMANGSGLGQTYYFGTYSLKDSLITIDGIDLDACIKTNTFVIRKDNPSNKDMLCSTQPLSCYITQVDGHGKELDKTFRFLITEDNR